MIAALRAPDRRETFIGLAIGLYATLVALAPGLTRKAFLCAPILAVPVVWRILRTPCAWLALFFTSALLLPPLPIRLGDSGPHVALLFAAAGLMIGLVRFWEWRFQSDPLATCLLALLAIVTASVAMALIYSGFEIAAASFARVLLLGISVYVFLYVRNGPGRMELSQSFRWIRLLFWAAATSALFACVDFYFQFPAPAGFEPQFIWIESGVFRRAQGIFYEASTLGNFCAFFLVMIAVALFRPRGTRSFSVFTLLTGGAALAAALVLSFSRASLLNLAIALAVLFWFHRNRIRWRRVAIGAVVLGAAAVTILVVAFPNFTSAYWQRVAASFQYFGESPNLVLSGRVRSWELLVQFLISNPWHVLLGVGYKTLPYSDFIGTTAIGDNTYLTLLAETGIAGLAALLALNAAILSCAYRAARSTDELRSFCGVWMLCFWSGQVVQMFSADVITYWRVLPVYFFVLALATRRPA
jgi:O-antigen ligase